MIGHIMMRVRHRITPTTMPIITQWREQWQSLARRIREWPFAIFWNRNVLFCSSPRQSMRKHHLPSPYGWWRKVGACSPSSFIFIHLGSCCFHLFLAGFAAMTGLDPEAPLIFVSWWNRPEPESVGN